MTKKEKFGVVPLIAGGGALNGKKHSMPNVRPALRVSSYLLNLLIPCDTTWWTRKRESLDVTIH